MNRIRRISLTFASPHNTVSFSRYQGPAPKYRLDTMSSTSLLRLEKIIEDSSVRAAMFTPGYQWMLYAPNRVSMALQERIRRTTTETP